MTDTFRLGTTDRKLDPLLVEQGIEEECPLRPGLFVTVLPAGTFNSRFRRAVRERAERDAERLVTRNGKADGAERDRFEDPDFVAQALVARMRGVSRGDGTEVEYTPELGAKLLGDPGNADVLAWVATRSMTYERFYTEGVEADAKNSFTGSSGRKAGAARSAKTRS